MSSTYSDQILTEKLGKLDNLQQSIETLSHWCIFHRKKAQSVVQTWHKQLRVTPRERRVPFLYLANDILQNSRHRGEEFVKEFWKVLPGALKSVIENGDSKAQSVVSRLVDIWDERKVFGSRTRKLKEELLGNEPPTDLLGKRVKSSHTSKIKVPAGGIQEKLISAYWCVQDLASNEDATLGRCNAAVIRIESLAKEVDTLENSGGTHDAITLTEELNGQQAILDNCIEQLDMCELARSALISHLKEALREQDSKLQLIRSQLQMARTQSGRSVDLHHLLNSTNCNSSKLTDLAPTVTELGKSATILFTVDQYKQSVAHNAEHTASLVEEFANPINVIPSAAAEVAAKLTSSSSSAQMLASALSSMVAEDSTTVNAPLEVACGTISPEKRRRLDGQTNNMQYSRVDIQQPFLLQSPVQISPLQPSSDSLQNLQNFSLQQSEPRCSFPTPYPHWPQYSGNPAVRSGNFGAQPPPAAQPLLPPMPPPQPPPLPPSLSIYTQQILPNSQIVSNIHNVKPVNYSLLQPRTTGIHGYMPLPTNHLQRQ